MYRCVCKIEINDNSWELLIILKNILRNHTDPMKITYFIISI